MPTQTNLASRQSHTGQRLATLTMPQSYGRADRGRFVGGYGAVRQTQSYGSTTIAQVASPARGMVLRVNEPLQSVSNLAIAPAMTEAPSNEIGALYRIAYWTAVGARLTRQGEPMTTAALAKDAAGALAKAELYRGSRLSSAGQITDSGKRLAPIEIAKMLIDAGVSLDNSGAPAAGAELKRLANTAKIKQAQIDANEAPGVRSFADTVTEGATKLYEALPDLPDVPKGPKVPKWVKWSVLGGLTIVGYKVIVGRPLLKKNGRDMRKTIAPIMAMAVTAFGAVLVVFPDPAPFVGPSTILGLPLMLGGLYYFGISDRQPKRTKNSRRKAWLRRHGRRALPGSVKRRSSRKSRGGYKTASRRWRGRSRQTTA